MIKNKKKVTIFHYILVIIMAIWFCSFPIFGAGTPNIDSGGGSMDNSVSSDNKWSVGHDGVRITVFHAGTQSPASSSVDLSNISISSSVYHFGKVNKSSYIGVSSLSLQMNGYNYIKPTQPLPTIISSSGSANLAAIKSYFTDEQVLRSISNYVGFDYDTLINGEYKLMVEPIAYFTYSGNYMCATATEAAIYDRVTGNDLWYWLRSMTHKNLPLSIFLEENDLGFSAWSGSTSTEIDNSSIIACLGIGVVRFDDLMEEELDEVDFVYRTDTEVITAVTVTGGQSDPDNPTTVTFSIGGTSYNVGNVYYPEGASQLAPQGHFLQGAWVKWRTPTTEQDMTIHVSVTGPGSTTQTTITCRIEDLDKNPPPNPVATDRNDSFSSSSVPSKAQSTSSNWTTFTPWWQPYWVFTGFSWVDMGWWEFDTNYFSASLSANMTLTVDSNSPTSGGTVLKSGYGYQEKVTASISTNGSSAVSQTPNAVAYFPEFKYETYWRLLERMSTGLSPQLEYKENIFSTYNTRTHFTPVWYPDGGYTVYTWLLDVWTPTGMLSMNLHRSLNISGNVWDDWHIGPQ